MMTNTYLSLLSFQELAHKLSKTGAQLVEEMTPAKAHLNHMTIGVLGEAGELADCIKAHTIYNKPLDLENLVEEIADLRFYLAGIMNSEGISEHEIVVAINEKLGKRYSEGSFSDEQAAARADKV